MKLLQEIINRFITKIGLKEIDIKLKSDMYSSGALYLNVCVTDSNDMKYNFTRVLPDDYLFNEENEEKILQSMENTFNESLSWEKNNER